MEPGMDRRSIFEAEAEAEAEGAKPSAFGRRQKQKQKDKNKHFMPKKIEAHLFFMLLKLVISTLPYNILAIDCGFENNEFLIRQKGKGKKKFSLDATVP